MLGRKDIETLIDAFAETIRERWKKLLDMYEKNNDVKKTVIATEFDANTNELFSQCDRSKLLSIPIAHSPLFLTIKEFIRKSEHDIDNDMNCVKSDVRNEVVPFYWLKSEAMKMIVFVNGEADPGKERRRMDERVHAHQNPRRPVGFPLADNIEKQHEDQRADTVAVNADDGSGENMRRAFFQQQIEAVLRDQAAPEGYDDQHDRLVFFADIRVDQHGEGQPDQLQQLRQQQKAAFL